MHLFRALNICVRTVKMLVHAYGRIVTGNLNVHVHIYDFWAADHYQLEKYAYQRFVWLFAYNEFAYIVSP